jgi:hypothetical protein
MLAHLSSSTSPSLFSNRNAHPAATYPISLAHHHHTPSARRMDHDYRDLILGLAPAFSTQPPPQHTHTHIFFASSSIGRTPPPAKFRTSDFHQPISPYMHHQFQIVSIHGSTTSLASILNQLPRAPIAKAPRISNLVAAIASGRLSSTSTPTACSGPLHHWSAL